MDHCDSKSECLAIKICKWEDVLRILPKLKRFFFRGQTNSEWKLTTSIERTTINNKKCLLDDLPKIEKDQLYNFKRMAHHYISDLPHFNKENLEWLALLQHYGGKTRMLDFTYSCYVAAFFATEDHNSDVDGAIWAIDGTKIKPREKLPKIDYNGFRVSKKEIESHRKLFEYFFKNGSDDEYICFTEPRRLNDRISKQQGLFLCPSKVNCSFECCLMKSMGLNHLNLNDIELSSPDEIPDEQIANSSLLKIVISGDQKTILQRELARMNITAASLFPGLDGYIRSLWNTCLFNALK